MYIDYDLLWSWIGHILRTIGISVVLFLYIVLVFLPVMAYDYLFMTYDIGPFGGKFGTGH